MNVNLANEKLNDVKCSKHSETALKFHHYKKILQNISPTLTDFSSVARLT